MPAMRVGHRAAGHLDARPHRRVEALGLLGVDQRHPALLDAVRGQERVVGLRHHIDDRVADAHHVKRLLRHSEPLVRPVSKPRAV